MAPAQAQDSGNDAMRAELDRMRAQMNAMAGRIAELEERLEDEQASAPEHSLPSNAVPANASASTSAAVSAESAAARTSAAAPVATLQRDDGWSFKPFGRLQVDAGSVSAPKGIDEEGLGFSSEIRRVRMGMKGDAPGGFGYKVEVDFAGLDVQLADAVLTYEDGDLTVSAGHHNTFQGLEELSSSLHTSFVERAAFTDAFGFERRVGLSAQYTPGPFVLQAGIFTDNVDDLADDADNSWSVDGRMVFSPRLDNIQLHLGGSFHYREFNDSAATIRYRQRPFIHTTDVRFLDTGSFSATGETGYGLEGAVIAGAFHMAAETYWQRVARPGALADPNFFGGYIETGLFLTPGDHRGYKGGRFDRVKPAHPVGEGGLGAVQINLRYDYLDLDDSGINGGIQNGYEASLIWALTDFTRLMANYGRMEYDRAPLPAAGDQSYGVDTFAVRAQVDF
ncbi:hypothetical protein GRI91_13470 [Altererythrobacter endophyticus]|uniref:Porin n=2 Tax=Altericroceibacterium endophyticum TaxID=1808508 RepID=A0A6I4TA70_9SPHN|nr:porin [Altericroceibacterium endophyticum]MXO66770.1 hypothetical protein [Altericroceibacterium endophyticum]